MVQSPYLKTFSINAVGCIRSVGSIYAVITASYSTGSCIYRQLDWLSLLYITHDLPQTKLHS